MSSIVKGNIARITPRTNKETGIKFVSVSVIDNHRRKDETTQQWIDTGATFHDITFNAGIAERIVASFQPGQAVLAEVENQRSGTYQNKNGETVALIRSSGIDLGLSARYKAFGTTEQ